MDNKNLTYKILVAICLGFIAGVCLYSFLPHSFLTDLLTIAGKIFLNSLKMLVVPVVFVSLVCGVINISSSERFKYIALKTLLLYLFTTFVAISLALLITSYLNIGATINNSEYFIKKIPSIKETISNIFPSNPIAALANGNMLQIIIFALLLGIAINKAKTSYIKDIFIEANNVVMQLVNIIFYFAPYGIFCLIASLFAKTGINILNHLAQYFFTVLVILLIHGLITYSAMLFFIAKLAPYVFFKKMRDAIIFAFSTSSSNASIPVVLSTVHNKLGVKKSIASFIIPLGATINMDGTTIMQGVATIFIANSYHIELGLSKYLMIILLATLASIGTAGIPGVGLITLTMVLTHVGIPIDGIAMIIGIDRILDMCRTAINVCGDASVACVVAKLEGELDEKVFYS